LVWHWGVRADSKTAFFLNLLPTLDGRLMGALSASGTHIC